MSDTTERTSDRTMKELLGQYALWVFTGVSGFIGWTVYSMSVSVGQLAIEVKHLTNSSTAYREDVLNLQKQVAAIRDEQLSRTKAVYDVGKIVAEVHAIEKRLDLAESDLASVRNIRWNRPDHEQFLREEFYPLRERMKKLEQ